MEVTMSIFDKIPMVLNKLDNISLRSSLMGTELNNINNEIINLLDKEAYRRLQRSNQLQYKVDKYDFTNENNFLSLFDDYENARAKFNIKKKIIKELEPDEPEQRNVNYLINQYESQKMKK